MPYKALREAIINSLCHRQWERYNLLNSIAIYDDRVEIGNPGIFPSQITPENIKEPHDSYPYNVKMAEVLYRSMWLENWGSGAKRIIEACQEQGVEEPTWRWDGAFVYVTFKRPVKHDSSIDQVPTKQDPRTIQAQSNPPLSTIENANSAIESTIETLMSSIEFINGNTEHKIIELLKLDGSLTIDQLYPILKMSRKGVQKAIERLKAKGTLFRDGSTKGGRWIVNMES